MNEALAWLFNYVILLHKQKSTGPLDKILNVYLDLQKNWYKTIKIQNYQKKKVF